MDLHIKQCDIDGAKYGAHRCPIARALNREVGADALVGKSTASVIINGEHTLYNMNDTAVEWRRGFDRGDVMHPVTLQLVDTGIII